ncbi:hypothetical protein DFH06DRAFT_1488131, partial [Mycena polygramma]
MRLVARRSLRLLGARCSMSLRVTWDESQTPAGPALTRRAHRFRRCMLRASRRTRRCRACAGGPATSFAYSLSCFWLPPAPTFLERRIIVPVVHLHHPLMALTPRTKPPALNLAHVADVAGMLPGVCGTLPSPDAIVAAVRDSGTLPQQCATVQYPRRPHTLAELYAAPLVFSPTPSSRGPRQLGKAQELA